MILLKRTSSPHTQRDKENKKKSPTSKNTQKKGQRNSHQPPKMKLKRSPKQKSGRVINALTFEWC